MLAVVMLCTGGGVGMLTGRFGETGEVEGPRRLAPSESETHSDIDS